MAIPTDVYYDLAQAGYEHMQHRRFGLDGCGPAPDLLAACEWLFIHQQTQDVPLGPGIVLAPSTSSSPYPHHDAPFHPS